MVRLRVLSDLHLEFYNNNPQKLWKKIHRKLGWHENEVIDQENEILVLAGDLGVPIAGAKRKNNDYSSSMFAQADQRRKRNKPNYVVEGYKTLLRMFRNKWNHVVFVSGNHEYWSDAYDHNAVDALLLEWANEVGVHYLQQESVTIHGIKFLGCTLRSLVTEDDWCQMGDSDFVSHEVQLNIHRSHRVWIEQELAIAKMNRDPVVVVTHHLPTERLIFPAKNKHTGYFTNLDFILQEHVCKNEEGEEKNGTLLAWVCGHSHNPVHISLSEKSQLILNPFGYPAERMWKLPQGSPFELFCFKKQSIGGEKQG